MMVRAFNIAHFGDLGNHYRPTYMAMLQI